MLLFDLKANIILSVNKIIRKAGTVRGQILQIH